MCDAPDPELIALRLLTALWPNIRRRFALSTFALSPEKIGGRDFDLVFAPLNAKAKFSDWPGRHVDVRSSQTDQLSGGQGAIVRRVFEAPVPRLLSDDDIDLLGDRDTDSAAALRIALLWDELLDKLHQPPTAALGLLDIANSGMVSNVVAVKLLEPPVAEPHAELREAWPPMMPGTSLARSRGRCRGTTCQPAGWRSSSLRPISPSMRPRGAVNLMRKPDPKDAIDDLIPSIATGLGKGTAPRVEQVLVEAPGDIIARALFRKAAH